MGMRYAVRQIGDVTVLDLSGRLSLYESLAFEKGNVVVLQDLIREQISTGHLKILINLADVSYLDSSGLVDLVFCVGRLRNQGGELRVCNAFDRLLDIQHAARLLRMARLDSVLNFDRDENAALQAFARHQLPTTTT